MVEARSQGLRAAREFRGRPRAAEIGPHDVRMGSEFRDGPNEIARRKLTAFPVCDGLVLAQAIQVDRKIQTPSRQPPRKRPEAIAPVRGTHRGGQQLGLAASVAVIGPRMHLQASTAQGPMICKEAGRPPIFEATQSPDACQGERGRQIQCAIDPAAARPTGRPNIPIRMIVKGDQRERLIRKSLQPKRGQMMKIARPKKQVRRPRNDRRNFPVERLDRGAWRDEAQARSPGPQIDPRQVTQNPWPRPVEIQM